LLTGGRYSQVVVKSGLTVHNDKQLIFLSGIPILGNQMLTNESFNKGVPIPGNQMLPCESDWLVGRALLSRKGFCRRTGSGPTSTGWCVT